MLDATDFKILAELAENAKYSYAEIGRKLSLHPNVVAYRVNTRPELT
jgi:DNA-binding Lrp family transcriptional regulator